MGEVPLDVTQFPNTQNIQSVAKEAINSSIREILHSAQEFPFTLVTQTQTLTVGTGVYSLPTNAASVDWESFYLKKLTAANNSPARLFAIPYTQYLNEFRIVEDNAGTSGYRYPSNVYQTQDFKFGVTPLPNAAYQIEYKYWQFPDSLVDQADVCIIPSRFDTVIIDGAMMYMMLYRSNEQSAAIHKDKFENGIKTMRRLLCDEPLQVRSTVKQYPYFSPRSF
jgi:hypothetical protein